MISKSNTPSKQHNNITSQTNQYYSVEFTLDEHVPFYQFKLRNNESMALFVLVKEDSKILDRLEVGLILNMKYNNTDLSCPPDYFKTQIKDITIDDNGRFSGHCKVGLSILPFEQTNQLN